MKISNLLEHRQGLFEGLGVDRDPYFENWERNIHPVLIEMALDPEKIKQLFAATEKSVSLVGLYQSYDCLRPVVGILVVFVHYHRSNTTNNNQPDQGEYLSWSIIVMSI